jgi:hypothetical protein
MFQVRVLDVNDFCICCCVSVGCANYRFLFELQAKERVCGCTAKFRVVIQVDRRWFYIAKTRVQLRGDLKRSL